MLDVPVQLQEGAGQDEAAGPGKAQQRVQEGEEPQVRGGAASGEGEEEGEVHELQDAQAAGRHQAGDESGRGPGQ